MPDSTGVIFDMDGVLVDSTEAHFVAWSRLGERIGTPCPRELFDRTFGMHNNQIIPIWLGDDLPPERVAELSSEKEAIYREEAASLLEPLPGAVALIESLSRAGTRLAVGSSGPAANVRLVLGILGVSDHFTALSTGDEVTHGKPDPEVFLIASRKLELPPARCIVIEDAPQGVEAGIRAGCRVIAVTSTRPAADLSGAHRIVESLEELDAGAMRSLVG